MELVPLFRVLWRRRIVVGVGGLLAIVIAVMVGPATPVRGGVATTRVVLDTVHSQVVYRDPKGADTLTWRAVLLTDLMATEDTRASIARAVGVPESQLVIVIPALTAPSAPTTLPMAASEAAAIRPERYVIAFRYDETLPIISIETHAPSRAAAARLAAAATRALQADSSPTTTDVTQGFVVDSVAPIQMRATVSGSGPVKAIGLAMVFFCFWSACVAVAPRIVRVLRSGGTGPVSPARSA
jgi:hypothetical protein